MPRDISFQGPAGGGNVAAVVEDPAGGGPAPGILILHEIFGVTDFMRNRVEFFAARGYAAMAPDLYWRVAPGAVFGYEGAAWDEALATRNLLDDDQTVADIGTMVDFLKQSPQCNGQVALVGYCLGGLYAYLGAARLAIAAAASFHGVRLESRLEEAPHVQAPLVLHFCGLDTYVPQEAVAQVKDALEDRAGVEIYDYPNSDHGFTREGFDVYNEDDAALAHQRTYAVFDKAFA